MPPGQGENEGESISEVYYGDLVGYQLCKSQSNWWRRWTLMPSAVECSNMRYRGFLQEDQGWQPVIHHWLAGYIKAIPSGMRNFLSNPVILIEQSIMRMRPLWKPN